jgi:hypothetical protein
MHGTVCAAVANRCNGRCSMQGVLLVFTTQHQVQVLSIKIQFSSPVWLVQGQGKGVVL